MLLLCPDLVGRIGAQTGFLLLARISTQLRKALCLVRPPVHLRRSKEEVSSKYEDVDVVKALRSLQVVFQIVGLSLEKDVQLSVLKSVEELLKHVGPSLSHLSIARLEDSGLRFPHQDNCVSKGLECCTQILSLNVSRNPIKGFWWANSVGKKVTITSLNLERCRMTNFEFGQLCVALREMPSLNLFNMKRGLQEKLSLKFIDLFRCSLANLTTLKTLNVADVKVSGDPPEHMLKALTELTTLTSLDISRNHIEAAGLEHVCKKHPSLVSLDLSHIALPPEFAQWLLLLTSLNTIHLRRCRMNTETQNALRESLSAMASVEVIYI